MRRYLDTARRYRWVILAVLAITWGSGAALAYSEYTTSYEADATIWTQRTSQQFASISPLDPGLTTFLTPASEQAGVLMQLLQTRNFLREVVAQTSVRVPTSPSDERRFFEEFSKRFRVEILGTNLFRLSYRARDPLTGPEVVLATLAQRQEHLAASRVAATDAATSFYRSELALAQTQALNAQRELDRFEGSHRPPLLPPDEYQQRQLRLALEDAKTRVSDLNSRIDRSGAMPGILQMADSLDFQVIDQPLREGKPSGGMRPALMIGGSAAMSGIALAVALILAGTLLLGRVGAESDIGGLVPATLFATIPEVARGKGWGGRDLRTALAALAFAPARADFSRNDR
jgi:hypothetical protein